ncbi:MAG: hypothetical protein ACT4QD_08050 [Acidobacteriota bacterium]
MALHMFKESGTPDLVIPTFDDLIGPRDASRRIRCPLCRWSPTAGSVWACDSTNAPEPFFGGCGTVWNTFATHGKCPGCTHQWHWTSCLSCHGWSLHEDWYEEQDDD